MELVIIDFVFIGLLTAFAYASSNNLILMIFIGVVSILYFTIIFNPKYKRYRLKAIRYHECYNFFNTFLISFSVTNSLSQAFERTTINASKSLKEELNGIKELEVVEKLKYLSKYFPFHIYSLFLNIIDLFIEEGGDILKMSTYLLKEGRNIEEYIDACYQNATKKVVEIFLLWLLSLSLLVFIRFGLAQFFQILEKQIFYPLSIGAFFLFVIISIDVSITKLLDVEIQGFKGYEKNHKLLKKSKFKR